MPKALHQKLKRTARRKGLKGKRAKAYIYGTMNKLTGKSAVGEAARRKR